MTRVNVLDVCARFPWQTLQSGAPFLSSGSYWTHSGSSKIYFLEKKYVFDEEMIHSQFQESSYINSMGPPKKKKGGGGRGRPGQREGILKTKRTFSLRKALLWGWEHESFLKKKGRKGS